jgi:hypothetical protein
MAKVQNPVITALAKAAITDDAWGFQLAKPEAKELRLLELQAASHQRDAGGAFAECAQ